jgi:hypothetical protein
VGKVVVEAPQKTPLLLSKDFASSHDHYENFPDRFEAGYRLQLEGFFAALREGRTPTPGPEDAPPCRRCHQELARKTAGEAFGDWNLTGRQRSESELVRKGDINECSFYMSQMSSQTAPEPKGPYLNFVEGFGYAGSGDPGSPCPHGPGDRGGDPAVQAGYALGNNLV